MDANTATQAWTSAATTYSAQKGGGLSSAPMTQAYASSPGGAPAMAVKTVDFSSQAASTVHPSTPGTATASTGTKTSRDMRKHDLHCVHSSQGKEGATKLTNVCSQNVMVAFCYVEAEQGTNKAQYLCKPQKNHWAAAGTDYATQWPGAISPGGSMEIGWNPERKPNRLVWVACEVPYIKPIISGIAANKEAMGYCVNPN